MRGVNMRSELEVVWGHDSCRGQLLLFTTSGTQTSGDSATDDGDT